MPLYPYPPRQFSREEVIALALHWGLDMSDWEEPRIQQIVDAVNTPLEFPKVKIALKDDMYQSCYLGSGWSLPSYIRR